MVVCTFESSDGYGEMAGVRREHCVEQCLWQKWEKMEQKWL